MVSAPAAAPSSVYSTTKDVALSFLSFGTPMYTFVIPSFNSSIKYPASSPRSLYSAAISSALICLNEDRSFTACTNSSSVLCVTPASAIVTSFSPVISSIWLDDIVKSVSLFLIKSSGSPVFSSALFTALSKSFSMLSMTLPSFSTYISRHSKPLYDMLPYITSLLLLPVILPSNSSPSIPMSTPATEASALYVYVSLRISLSLLPSISLGMRSTQVRTAAATAVNAASPNTSIMCLLFSFIFHFPFYDILYTCIHTVSCVLLKTFLCINIPVSKHAIYIWLCITYYVYAYHDFWEKLRCS